LLGDGADERGEFHRGQLGGGIDRTVKFRDLKRTCEKGRQGFKFHR